MALTSPTTRATFKLAGSDALPGFVATPEDRTYVLALDLPYVIRLRRLTAKTEVGGTLTATVQVAGTPVTGLSLAVSTTEDSASAAFDDTAVVAPGQQLELVVASNSGGDGFAFTLEYDRLN